MLVTHLHLLSVAPTVLSEANFVLTAMGDMINSAAHAVGNAIMYIATCWHIS